MHNKGSIFSELRREAGYTQKTLADVLKITDKAVSKWERGICLPDISLLPKLSLLLDADIELLLDNKASRHSENWIGFLDLQESEFDLSQVIYDKPAVYYMLSHYLLLGMTDIYVRTTLRNKKYLQSEIFSAFGFNFTFDFLELPKTGVMIMNKPCFLFGSDLTRIFQVTMLTGSLAKANPLNSPVPFLFCPSEYAFMYMKNPDYLFEIASDKTFGRGMVCIEMGTPDSNNDVSTFVKIYQNNTGMLIGSLEEIAYRRQLINELKLKEMLTCKPYRNILMKSLSVE